MSYSIPSLNSQPSSFTRETPSTLNPKPSTIEWPPSVQSDLWGYLKPEQREFMQPILRLLKKHAQEELCSSLLDYMESGEVLPPQDFVLGALFFFVTRAGGGFTDEPENRKIIRPLHYRGREPQRIGKIIEKILPSLKGRMSKV